MFTRVVEITTKAESPMRCADNIAFRTQEGVLQGNCI
jgi:hypothetical protein